MEELTPSDYEDYEDYEDYDYSYNETLSLPPFPSLLSHNLPKCCPHSQLLGLQEGGLWVCVLGQNFSLSDLGRVVASLSQPRVEQVELEHQGLGMCIEGGEEAFVWSPGVLDLRDHQDMERNMFFDCIDGHMQNNTVQPLVMTCSPSPLDTCLESSQLRVVMVAFGLVSILAVVLALFAYCLVPRLRNIHGQVVVNNLVSCLAFLSFLVTTYTSCWTLWPLPGQTSCQVLAYLGYFSTLAMFSWMSTLCFDVFWTLARPKFTVGPKTGKRLLLYHVLGWFLPFLLTLVLGILDHTHRGSILTPRFGQENCFLDQDSTDIFLDIPILISMIINVVLYAVTVVFIFKTRKEIRDKSSVGDKRVREDLVIFSKLFLVMGLLWVGEIVSHYWHSSVFSGILGVLNLSRGSFMFVVFILKKTVLQDLHKIIRKTPLDYKATRISKLSTDTGSPLTQAGKTQPTANTRKVSSQTTTSRFSTKISITSITSETEFK